MDDELWWDKWELARVSSIFTLLPHWHTLWFCRSPILYNYNSKNYPHTPSTPRHAWILKFFDPDDELWWKKWESACLSSIFTLLSLWHTLWFNWCPLINSHSSGKLPCPLHPKASLNFHNFWTGSWIIMRQMGISLIFMIFYTLVTLKRPKICRCHP